MESFNQKFPPSHRKIKLTKTNYIFSSLTEVSTEAVALLDNISLNFLFDGRLVNNLS